MIRRQFYHVACRCAVWLLVAACGQPVFAQFGRGNSWGSNNSNRGSNAWRPNSGRGMSMRMQQSADANDGPSYPSNNTNNNSGGRWPGNSGRNNADNSWIPLMVDGIDVGIRALSRPQPNNNFNNNNNNNNSYNDYDDNYYNRPQRYYPSTPQVYTPAAPAPVKPKANTKPPEKVVVVRANKIDQGLSLLSDADRNLADKVVEQQAEKQIDDLEKSLGDAAKDPKVKEKLDEARQDIANGEPLDPNWADDLRKAASDSGQLPANVDTAALDKQVEDLTGLLSANSLLKQDPNASGGGGSGGGGSGGGGGGVLPSGPTDVLTMPFWPDDEMAMLPDGSLMVGTDGAGQIGVTTLDAQDVLGFPVGVGDPVPESAADVAKRPKSGVYLINPESTAAPINYVIANTNYEMQSGFSQALPEGQTWEISFDRGQGQGSARYTLSSGTYVFGAGKNGGWDLFLQTFTVVIDNQGNDGTFNYNIDNSQQEVGAGEKKTHTSNYPILVRFDRGDGGKEAQKRIAEKSATLAVAVNPKDGYWDLYPPNAASTTLVSQKDRTEGKVASAKGKDASRAARLRALLQKAAKK